MGTATSPASSTTPVDAVREPAGEADLLHTRSPAGNPLAMRVSITSTRCTTCG